MSLRLTFYSAILASLLIGPAAAAYPERPIRIIVGLPAGTTVDIVARLIGNHFSDRFKQTVVIENKVGAQGLLAAKELVSAPPNGYTLHLAGSISSMDVTMKEGANISDQFSYISLIRRSPTYIAVTTKRPFNNLKDLIEFGKKNPKVLNYGSIAKSLELYLAIINQTAGVDAVHVAFRGSNDASASLISGDIDYYLESASFIEPLAARGQAKIIAATSAKRSEDRPDIPGLEEAGLPGLDLMITYGLVGPKGMPDDIVGLLNQSIREFAATPAIIERFLAMAQGKPAYSSPEEFRRHVRAEIEIIARTAKAMGMERQ